MKGRKAIPTETKRRRGNPGRRPLNKKEPSAGKRPETPDDLPPHAAKLWDRLVDHLGSMGVLDRADMTALEMLCRAWAEMRECEETIAKVGRTYKTKNTNGDLVVKKLPHVVIASNAWSRVRSLLPEFGLTPSARVRLGSQGEEEDELDKLMREFGKG